MMEHIRQTAKEAAEQTGKLIRSETRADLLEMKDQIKTEISETIRDEIKSEMMNHFGDMTMAEHIVQHTKITEFIDDIKDVKKAWIKKVATAAAIALLAGSIGWNKDDLPTVSGIISSKVQTPTQTTSEPKK